MKYRETIIVIFHLLPRHFRCEMGAVKASTSASSFNTCVVTILAALLREKLHAVPVINTIY